MTTNLLAVCCLCHETIDRDADPERPGSRNLFARGTGQPVRRRPVRPGVRGVPGRADVAHGRSTPDPTPADREDDDRENDEPDLWLDDLFSDPANNPNPESAQP